MAKKEIRTLMMTPTIRSESAGDNKMIVDGYAAVFDSRTLLYHSEWTDYDYFEEIAPEAFNGADMSDTILTYNHGDAAMVLARATNNTLQLSTDEKGLKVRAELADTTAGRDLYTLIKRGDISKMSFAFTIDKSTVEEDRENKSYLRRITQIGKLYDVAAVDFPAYDDTSIEARNTDAMSWARVQDDHKKAEWRKRLILLSMC